MNLHGDPTSFWLPTYTGTGPSLPIDVVVNANGKHFPANKALLAHQSGYFKSILVHQTCPPIITLPTVPSEFFAILLAGMYSGSFDINNENVYQILLYSQLLQIPSAVHQCKTFVDSKSLGNDHGSKPFPYPGLSLATSSPSILHPLPTRSQLSSSPGSKPVFESDQVLRPIPSHPVPTMRFDEFKMDFPWKPWHLYHRSFVQSASTYRDWLLHLSLMNRNGPLDTASYQPLPQVTAAPPLVSPSKSFAPSSSIAGGPPFATEESKVAAKKIRRSHSKKDHQNACKIESSVVKFEEQALDIAACDGPVRFHRVINVSADDSSDQGNFDDNSIIDVASCTSSEDESSRQRLEDLAANRDTNEIFQCVFCNHVFKSHYCYQKHKRRHINPFTVDFQKAPPGSAPSVKDINVQFFPCKICGAKFPSYYFVHKHKKLWHAEDEDPESAEKTGEKSEDP